jgi:hypothetical protein
VEEYIVLDVWGAYFFWPLWTNEPNGVLLTVPQGTDRTDSILQFTWPQGVGAASDLRFWAALLDPATMSLACDYDMVTRGYE